MSDPVGYFITFTCYGARLHGHKDGSFERLRDGSGTRELEPDVAREVREYDELVTDLVVLNSDQRRVTAATIQEVARYKGWRLHALNVRSNHVHAVVSGNVPPERMMTAFKSWATRRLREARLVRPDATLWTRHGSTRHLWNEAEIAAAGLYVFEGQGDDLGGVRWDQESECQVTSRAVATASLPYGRIWDLLLNRRTPIAR